MTKNWERFLIAAMPVGMLLLWLAIVARGDGRLDAMGNPVGGDFAMFYIAGNMAWQGEWHLLYNEAEQQRRLIELFPGLPLDTYLPYRYPPTLAAVLAPLGALPYRTAQLLWSLASIAAWLASWLALSRVFLPSPSKLAGTCLVGVIASPVCRKPSLMARLRASGSAYWPQRGSRCTTNDTHWQACACPWPHANRTSCCWSE